MWAIVNAPQSCFVGKLFLNRRWHWAAFGQVIGPKGVGEKPSLDQSILRDLGESLRELLATQVGIMTWEISMLANKESLVRCSLRQLFASFHCAMSRRKCLITALFVSLSLLSASISACISTSFSSFLLTITLDTSLPFMIPRV